MLSAASAGAGAQVPESSAAAAGLEEVVVTAQKQSEDLQRTAAAVTVLSSAELVESGVTDLRSVQMLAPSVRFQAEGNNTQVFIRGVGANLDFANVEQSVGFVINGAYIPREGTSAAFFDLGRLEVLPGPQGTLYGRSSIGGTIVLTANRPAHNWDGNALLELEDYSGVHAGYAQNFPLTDSLALRGAFDYRYHEGYNKSGGDSKDDYGVRLSALYEPSDDFSIFFWTQYAEKNGHPQNLVNKGYDPATGEYREDAFLHDDEWDDTRTGDLEPLAPFGQAVADEQQYETFMTGGELNWSVGPGVLTWIPSYFYLDSAPNYWLGTIRARLATHYNQVANELRYSNPDSEGIRYLAGSVSLSRAQRQPVYAVDESAIRVQIGQHPFQPDRERGGVRPADIPAVRSPPAHRGWSVQRRQARGERSFAGPGRRPAVHVRQEIYEFRLEGGPRVRRGG